MTPKLTSQKVTWTSSNKKIATVNSKGKISTKKAGTVTITAKTANGKTATVKIKVVLPDAKKVVLSKKGTVKLTAGKTLTLKATVTPKLASQKVTWTSSNKKIATVSSSGKVTAKKIGSVTITAKTANGKKASVKIKVVKGSANDADLPEEEKTTETIFEEIESGEEISGSVDTEEFAEAEDDMKPAEEIRSGWISEPGAWYFCDETGSKRTGWLSQIEDDTETWYWLYKKTGEMASEEWKEVKGVRYYFGKDGRMYTGWQIVDGCWELFNDRGAWQESGEPV